MGRHKGIFGAVVSIAQVCILAAIVAVAHGGAGAGATGDIAITGTVTNQHGNGVQNVSVFATDPGGSTVEFGPSTTAFDGSYELDVIAGTYDLHFDPASGSGLNPIVDNDVMVLNNQTINIQLTPITHTLSGTILDQNGNPISTPGGGLGFTDSHGNSVGADVGTNGHYSLQVIPGVYRLTDYSDASTGADVSGSGPNVDLTNGNATQDIAVPALASLAITVKHSDGNPVPQNTNIFLFNSNITASIEVAGSSFSFNGSYHGSANSLTHTDSNGVAHFNMMPTTSIPANGLCAQTSPQVCNTSTLTVSSDTNTTLTVPATHNLTGTVHDQNGNTVTGGSLGFTSSTGNSTGADIDSTGHYSLRVNPGIYHLTDYIDSNTSADVSGNGPNVDLTSGDAAQDIVVPTLVPLTITVKYSNGDPVPVNTNVFLFNGSITSSLNVAGSSFTFNGSYGTNSSDHLTHTDSNGVDTFQTIPTTSIPVGGLCAQTTPQVCNTEPLSISSATNVTLTVPITHTLSGTIYDQNGNPASVPGGSVAFTDGHGNTAGADVGTNGQYSVNVNPGVYHLFDYSEATSKADVSGTGPNVDLTAGDATQNIVVPALVPLTITVKDSDGNLVPNNTNVFLFNSSISASLNVANTSTTFTGNYSSNSPNSRTGTNANGVATMQMLPTTTIPVGGLCTQTTPQVCNTSPISINNATSIVFQQEPPAPQDPTNLSVSSPTQYPHLMWVSVSGATSYNIFRNGTKIDSSSTNSYSDNTAPEGTDSYYVTAVNSGGESGQSNTVNVLVDRTNPTITSSVSPAANGAGWNNSTVTVTYTCTDNPGGSGVASCSSPQNESAEGTYNLTGSATDNAGNTNSTSVTFKIDTTAPTVGNASWSTNPVQVGNNSTLTVPATDSSSGISTGEYFVGTDPGVGNGTAMSYSSDTGNLTASFGSSLTPGVYNVGYRSKDAAGNWSTTSTTMLVVYDSNTTLSMTGKNMKDLTPSLANGDVIPGLNNNTQTDAVDYGFTVQYKNGALDTHNAFKYVYNTNTGTNCNKSTAQNCHTFSLNSTNFNWLTIGGTSNSQGWFQGTAIVTVGGTTTTNPFWVTGVDGSKLTPNVNDTLTLKVYAPGANPQTAAPIYHVSGSMPTGNSVKIQ